MAYRHRRTIVSLALLFAALATPAAAQDYPTRPVRIITESAPGAAIDVTLRVIADRLTQMWGQQVLAVNHPGAGGSIAARVASQAAPIVNKINADLIKALSHPETHTRLAALNRDDRLQIAAVK